MKTDLLDFKIQTMNGTGNSFAVSSFMSIENANSFFTRFNSPDMKSFVIKICKLLSVDGFIILTEAEDSKNDYKWLFFNNDGSEAEMCGNAARCVGHFSFKNHISGNEHTFESKAGNIEVIVDSEKSVTVVMPELTDVKLNINYNSNGKSINYSYVNTGVPHSVISIDAIENHKQHIEVAKNLRSITKNHENGSNVTFFSESGSDSINSISFERGVEDFTLACGTGAVAAAYVQYSKYKCPKITVNMPGGPVIVDFSGDKPYLIGPIEYDKVYFAEELNKIWTNSYTD